MARLSTLRPSCLGAADKFAATFDDCAAAVFGCAAAVIVVVGAATFECGADVDVGPAAVLDDVFDGKKEGCCWKLCSMCNCNCAAASSSLRGPGVGCVSVWEERGVGVPEGDESWRSPDFTLCGVWEGVCENGKMCVRVCSGACVSVWKGRDEGCRSPDFTLYL